RRRGPARSRGTLAVYASSRSLHAEWARFDAPDRRKLVTVQAQANLAERLEHVRSRALRRAVEALADRLVVEVVDLAHDEGQPLLGGQGLHRGLEQRSGLAVPGLVLGPFGIGLAACRRHRLMGDPPPFLRSKVVPAHVGRDGEEPGPDVRVRG